MAETYALFAGLAIRKLKLARWQLQALTLGVNQTLQGATSSYLLPRPHVKVHRAPIINTRYQYKVYIQVFTLQFRGGWPPGGGDGGRGLPKWIV